MKKLLFIFALLLCSCDEHGELSRSMVFAADTIFVDIEEDAVGYNYLEEAIVGETRDLPTLDSVIVFRILGEWDFKDTFEVHIDGYTTDATHPIIIRAEGAARHVGYYSTGNKTYYHGRLTRDDYGAFAIYEHNVRVEGIQVNQETSDNYDCCFNTYGGNSTSWSSNDTRIINCILRGRQGLGNRRKGANISGNWHIRNCVIYGFDNGTSGTGDKGFEVKRTAEIYNCTMWDNYYGIDVSTVDGDSCLVMNTIALDCTDNWRGTFAVGSDYNSSDDVTTPAGGGNDRTNNTPDFVDEVNDDYHLDGADTDAIDYGTDLSSDPRFPFSDDIDYEDRTGLTWDMGADERIAKGLRRIKILQGAY